MSLGNISTVGGDEARSVHFTGRSARGHAQPRAPAAEESAAEAAQVATPAVRENETRPEKAITQAVRELVLKSNSVLKSMHHQLRFRVHDATGQLTVQVVDFESGEVLRQQPPEEFLELAARIQEMVGVFLDRKS